MLFDTAVLVAVERGRATLSSMLQTEDDPAVAALTVAELLVGAKLGSGEHVTRRLRFIDEVLARFPVIPYDIAIVDGHAELVAFSRLAGSPRGAHDLIIAATARATDRAVLTLDRKGFEGLPGVSVRIPG